MKPKDDANTAWAEPLKNDRKMNQREKDGLTKKLMTDTGKLLGGAAMLGFAAMKILSRSNGK